MTEPFDEQYFTSGSYQKYLDRADRYARMALELRNFLDTMRLYKPQELHVDYGCGPGFFVKGLLLAHYRNVIGYDISDWAVREAAKAQLPVYHASAIPKTKLKPFCAFGLDVLEHMPDSDLESLLRRLRPVYWIVRIPVCHETGGKFVLRISEDDPTHIQRLTQADWIQKFDDVGYDLLCRLNLYTIWSSDAVLAAVFRKRVE